YCHWCHHQKTGEYGTRSEKRKPSGYHIAHYTLVTFKLTHYRGAGRPWLSRSARNSGSTRSSCAIACKEQPESKGDGDGDRFLHLQVARVVDEADTGPLGPDPRNKRVYARGASGVLLRTATLGRSLFVRAPPTDVNELVVRVRRSLGEQAIALGLNVGGRIPRV